MSSARAHGNIPFDALLNVSAQVPAQAMTADILGTERRGHGVALEGGSLILTIGYLIAEASNVWVSTAEGRTEAAYVQAYDYETGFGLIRPMQPLDLEGARLGDSSALGAGDRVVIAGCEEQGRPVRARVLSRREFVGHWEYVIPEALYVAPAHQSWAGTGLFNHDGELCGIGSLMVRHVDQDGDFGEANMHVPVQLLKPILSDLIEHGARRTPARPWLGVFVQDGENGYVVSGLYESGPAADAGLSSGDQIMAVDGRRPGDLGELFRLVWAQGPAGAAIPLTVMRDDSELEIAIISADRDVVMRPGSVH